MTFFISILTTYHQSKLEKLQSLKASMLEKMFPKNGSDVPDIRFKGFTKAWIKRKIGECFAERNESFPDGELLSVTINNGVRKFSELDRRDTSNSDKSKYKKVCVGDIAYNSMRMWQGASGYSPYEGIVSPAYTVLSPNPGINSKCIAYYFKSDEIVQTFQKNSQGITSDNWNLKFPALSKIEIRISPNMEEQKKIAAYFSQLDAGSVQDTEDTNVLVAKLKSNDPANMLIVTSIQKMSRIEENSSYNAHDIELIRDKRIVFIIDEAHRDVFGEMLRTIKETFPNAMFFGFTGTPIHEENQKKMSTTSDVFGNELHRYSIADGIRDKNVLGFDPYMVPTYKDRYRSKH